LSQHRKTISKFMNNSLITSYFSSEASDGEPAVAQDSDSVVTHKNFQDPHLYEIYINLPYLEWVIYAFRAILYLFPLVSGGFVTFNRFRITQVKTVIVSSFRNYANVFLKKP
jgi:hypothetical protein